MTTPTMIEPTQADREFAADWNYECRHCSEYEGNFETDLANAVAAHRLAHTAPAGEVEPVAWMYTYPGTVPRFHQVRSLWRTAWTETPLYTHPAPPADLVELVEAVKHLMQVGEFCRTDDTESALRAIRAALAKDEGA